MTWACPSGRRASGKTAVVTESAGPTPPSPDRCPGCGEILFGRRCEICGLELDGPDAARLWAIENELYELSVERRNLIQALRPASANPSARPSPIDLWPPPPREWMPDAPPGGWAPPPPAVAARRASEFGGDPGSPPLPVQTVLLALGAFSLIVAATVFLAVTWRGLSAAGKTATLAGLTVVFAGITTLLRRRSLTATAEALAVVTLMLGLADAYAVRVGLFPRIDRFLAWSLAFALLAVVDAGFAKWSRTVSPRIASAVLSQLALPVLATHPASSETILLAVLLVQSLVVVAVLSRRRPGSERFVTWVLAAGSALAWVMAVMGAAAVATSRPSQRPVAAGVLAGAGLVAAVVARWWADDADVALLGAGVATAAFLASALTLASRWLDGHSLAMTMAALAVVMASIAARVDRRWARGPLAVAGIAAVAASTPAWPVIGEALRMPSSAAAEAGTWMVGRSRSVVALEESALGASTFVRALGYIAILAVGVFGVRPRLGRGAVGWLLAGLAGAAAAVVPFAIDGSVWSATVILLAVGVSVAAVLLWRSISGTSGTETSWWALVVGVGTQGLLWALLSPGLTLGALVTTACTAAAGAVVGLQQRDQRMAEAGAVVSSVATAVAVPVAAHVAGLSAEIGWALLAGLAAAIGPLTFVAWVRSTAQERRSAALVVAGAAGAAYVVGAVGVGSVVSRTDGGGMLAAVFAAGSASAVAVTVAAVRRRLDTIPFASTVAGCLLALAAVAMVAVDLGLSASAAWLSVTVGASILSLGALVAEVVSLKDDVVGAIDTSAAIGAAAGLAALAASGSATPISLGLLAVTLALGVASSRPDRRAAAWVGALGALVLLWQRLLLAGVTTAEAFTLPAAAFLAAAGMWRHRLRPDEASWSTWGPALVVALGPSVLLTLRDPGLVRPIATVVAAAAVTLIGARWRRRAPVMIGATALVVLGIQQLAPFVRQLPRWLTFATVGTILLLVGASYERRRTQLAGLRQVYRRFH